LISTNKSLPTNQHFATLSIDILTSISIGCKMYHVTRSKTKSLDATFVYISPESTFIITSW